MIMIKLPLSIFDKKRSIMKTMKLQEFFKFLNNNYYCKYSKPINSNQCPALADKVTDHKTGDHSSEWVKRSFCFF